MLGVYHGGHPRKGGQGVPKRIDLREACLVLTGVTVLYVAPVLPHSRSLAPSTTAGAAVVSIEGSEGRGVEGPRHDRTQRPPTSTLV